MSKELTHVQFLREYADCLDKGIKPIDKFQYLNIYQEWTDISMDILEMGSKFRRKPNPFIINGVECPRPLTDMPWYGDCYYVPDITDPKMYQKIHNANCTVDKINFERGIVYESKEDAVLVAEQMLGLFKPLEAGNE